MASLIEEIMLVISLLFIVCVLASYVVLQKIKVKPYKRSAEEIRQEYIRSIEKRMEKRK